MDLSQTIPIRNRIVGLLVERARVRAAKSTEQCAEWLACSTQHYEQQEQGLSGFSLPHLEALAYLFGVAPSELWDENGLPAPRPAVDPETLAEMLHLRRQILAIRFRQLRLDSGLSPLEMGNHLGVAAEVVLQYEAGERDIPLSALEIAAGQCGRPVDALMEEPLLPIDGDRQTIARLHGLPIELQEFVLAPAHVPYLRIAHWLSTLDSQNLKNLAAAIAALP